MIALGLKSLSGIYTPNHVPRLPGNEARMDLVVSNYTTLLCQVITFSTFLPVMCINNSVSPVLFMPLSIGMLCQDPFYYALPCCVEESKTQLTPGAFLETAALLVFLEPTEEVHRNKPCLHQHIE